MKPLAWRIPCPECAGIPQHLIGRNVPGQNNMHDYLVCWSCLIMCQVDKLIDCDTYPWTRFQDAPALAADNTDWVKHSRSHWTRMLDGDDLHYWPSTMRFRYRGVTQQGDVEAFIERITNLPSA